MRALKPEEVDSPPARVYVDGCAKTEKIANPCLHYYSAAAGRRPTSTESGVFRLQARVGMSILAPS